MRLGIPGKLRIAQVAPLSESVPPKLYGGTERVVSVLTEELVRQGHVVTLFASGDSRTSATLVAACDQAQRLLGCPDPLAAHMLMIEQVVQRAHEFDIVHFHVAPVHFPLARRMNTPHITTLHGRLDLPDLRPLYEEFSELPLVSISDAQRAPCCFPSTGPSRSVS
jgi:glycosyltransferase involved in cell wall biosynthesis